MKDRWNANAQRLREEAPQLLPLAAVAACVAGFPRARRSRAQGLRAGVPREAQGSAAQAAAAKDGEPLPRVWRGVGGH